MVKAHRFLKLQAQLFVVQHRLGKIINQTRSPSASSSLELEQDESYCFTKFVAAFARYLNSVEGQGLSCFKFLQAPLLSVSDCLN